MKVVLLPAGLLNAACYWMAHAPPWRTHTHTHTNGAMRPMRMGHENDYTSTAKSLDCIKDLALPTSRLVDSF